MRKKVLIIGSGGREHALVWKIAQSKLVGKIYCAPGNAGTSPMAQNIPIEPTEIEKLVDLAIEKRIDLTVVGPEGPLEKGIVDEFEEKKLKIFGPSKNAARLETDKSWAADFMERHHLPHPVSKTFTDPKEAIRFIKSAPWRFVIKASGLAAGKGVLLPDSPKQAVEGIKRIMVQKVFGRAGEKILIQERISGPEVSVLAFCDGKNVIPLPPVQDHKRAFDKDKGPNTGGMGAYCPVPLMTTKLLKEVTKTILRPTIEGIRKEGNPYRGVLYAGLMITKKGPQVLEFNARFGDPEAQPLMMLLSSDLIRILISCSEGNLHSNQVLFREGASVCVVVASRGYPGHYEKGALIYGLNKISDPEIQVFQTGTAIKDRKVLTNGGRVLGITAYGRNIKETIRKAYGVIGKKGVWFPKMHYRTDIGKKALI